MSQIDREMEQTARRRGPVTLLSSVAAFAAPLQGALAARPLHEPWAARAWRVLQATIEQGLDTISTWRERTRTRRQLATLDDRMLRDIGITRVQAQSEVEKPFWRI